MSTLGGSKIVDRFVVFPAPHPVHALFTSRSSLWSFKAWRACLNDSTGWLCWSTSGKGNTSVLLVSLVDLLHFLQVILAVNLTFTIFFHAFSWSSLRRRPMEKIRFSRNSMGIELRASFLQVRFSTSGTSSSISLHSSSVVPLVPGGASTYCCSSFRNGDWTLGRSLKKTASSVERKTFRPAVMLPFNPSFS